jgi:regulatory protein
MPSAFRKAYNFAIYLLSKREYSQFELQQRFLQKGYSPKDIKLILELLVEQNLQSDQRFAEQYIRSRKNKGFGKRRIAFELEQKRINHNLIQALLAEPEEVWQAHIFRVWKKKFSGEKPETLSEKARQTRFLQYRGFSNSQIQWLWQYENESNSQNISELF